MSFQIGRIISKYFKNKESIFLENFPKYNKKLIEENKNILENFSLSNSVVEKILNNREKAKIGVRWPLEKVEIICEKNIENNLKKFLPFIKSLTNIENIIFKKELLENTSYGVKPNFVNLKNDFQGEELKKAIENINKNKKIIIENIKKKELKIEGQIFNLEKHILKTLILDDKIISSPFNFGHIILHTNQNEKLLEMGFLREIIRRIQLTRKEIGLDKNEKMKISFEGSTKKLITIIKKNVDEIKIKLKLTK